MTKSFTITHPLTLSRNDTLWKELERWGLGWDEWFREMGVALHNSSRSDSHPPYNVWSPEENRTTLEIAVAGYDPARIAVTVHRKTLTVSCCTDEDTREYSVRGIARRPFVKHFTLGEWVRVESAEVANGMLTIKLVSEIPESQMPKTIPVKF
jgi:molecular chaperone IbpA